MPEEIIKSRYDVQIIAFNATKSATEKMKSPGPFERVEERLIFKILRIPQILAIGGEEPVESKYESTAPRINT